MKRSTTLGLAAAIGFTALAVSSAEAFLSTDPLGSKDDPNLYMYVGSDPVNYTDPSGLEAFIVGRRIFSDEDAAIAGRAAYLAAGGGIAGEIAAAAASAAVKAT